jgi:TPR repeat protein
MLRQALREAEGREAGHQRLVAQERDRNGQLERELATRQAVLPASDGSAKTAPANTRVSDGAGDGPAPIAAATDLDLSRLMARARVLLVQGDISAARVVLERAAEGGNAPALFALAETFDPAVLSSWGTLGTQGDVAQAQELYARALAGGVTEAKERMGASR